MRCIDADALEELFREVIGGIAKKPEMNGNLEHMVRASAMVIEMIQDAPTIEPRKKGQWLPDNNSLYEMRFVCSECHESEVVPTIGFTKYKPIWDFCPNCGADMRNPVEAARDIVHEAIDNSAWSDTVDTAKMHKVVDDKYAEMTKKTEESKQCDTCKHEKSRWFSRCADCSDYELWEGKDETGRSTTEN